MPKTLFYRYWRKEIYLSCSLYLYNYWSDGERDFNNRSKRPKNTPGWHDAAFIFSEICDHILPQFGLLWKNVLLKTFSRRSFHWIRTSWRENKEISSFRSLNSQEKAVTHWGDNSVTFQKNIYYISINSSI